MQNKRALIFLVTTVMLFGLVGCVSTATPKDTVNSLFTALKKYDTEAITKVVESFPDAKDCPITYDPFSDTPYVLLYQTAYKDLKYSVKSIDKSDDTHATIVVTVEHPDLKTAYTTALYSSLSMIFADDKLFNEIISDESKEISNYVPNQMQSMAQNGEITFINSDYTLTMEKGENGWIIKTDEQLKNLVSSNIYQIAANSSEIFNNAAE